MNNVSLYCGDLLLKYLQNVKRFRFDPVNDRRNWKIEKELVCLEGCFFIFIIDKFNQPKLLPVST